MLVRFSLTSLSSTRAMDSELPSWGPFLLPRFDLRQYGGALFEKKKFNLMFRWIFLEETAKFIHSTNQTLFLIVLFKIWDNKVIILKFDEPKNSPEVEQVISSPHRSSLIRVGEYPRASKNSGEDIKYRLDWKTLKNLKYLAMMNLWHLIPLSTLILAMVFSISRLDSWDTGILGKYWDKIPPDQLVAGMIRSKDRIGSH